MAPRYAKLPDWTRALLRNERPSTRDVYGVLLAWRPWDDDAEGRPCTTASPARSVIAKDTGLTERSVKRATARLVELGLIRKQHRGTRTQLYTLAWDAPFTDDPEPVLLLAIGNARGDTEKALEGTRSDGRVPSTGAVDNLLEGTPVSPLGPLEGTPVSPHRENYLENTRGRATSFTAVGFNSSDNSSSLVDSSTREDGSEEESGENGTNDDKTTAVRDRLNAVWPHDDARARELVRAAFAAGWDADSLVAYVRKAATAPGVRNQRGYALVTLGQLPPAPRQPERVRSVARPPTPRDPEAARRGAAAARAQLRARKTEDARDETTAEEMPTGSPTRPADVLTGMFTSLFASMSHEDALDPVEAFPSDADVLDALSDATDVLGNPITDDDYADDYADTEGLTHAATA